MSYPRRVKTQWLHGAGETKGLIMKGLTFDAKESGQWEQFKSHKPKNV